MTRPRAAHATAARENGASGSSRRQRSRSAERSVSTKASCIRARRPHAEGVRLPPLVEARVLGGRGDLAHPRHRGDPPHGTAPGGARRVRRRGRTRLRRRGRGRGPRARIRRSAHVHRGSPTPTPPRRRRTRHASHLGEPGDGIGHEVHDELGERRVERGVGEGQVFRGGMPDIDARVPRARRRDRTTPTDRRRRPPGVRAGGRARRSARPAHTRHRAPSARRPHPRGRPGPGPAVRNAAPCRRRRHPRRPRSSRARAGIPGIGTVEVPVVDHRAQPPSLGGGREREPPELMRRPPSWSE